MGPAQIGPSEHEGARGAVVYTYATGIIRRVGHTRESEGDELRGRNVRASVLCACVMCMSYGVCPHAGRHGLYGSRACTRCVVCPGASALAVRSSVRALVPRGRAARIRA